MRAMNESDDEPEPDFVTKLIAYLICSIFVMGLAWILIRVMRGCVEALAK